MLTQTILQPTDKFAIVENSDCPSILLKIYRYLEMNDLAHTWSVIE